MAYSSIMGADTAPTQPIGRSNDLLGPSDNSDSGSDAVGTDEARGDSDSTGTGERGVVSGMDGKEGADILPDRVVRLGSNEAASDAGVDGVPGEEECTDLDAESDVDQVREDDTDSLA